MATTWKAPTWRMPNEKNQSKFESYSLDFDGSSNYVDTGDAFTSLTSFSISAWFKSDDTSTAAQAIVSSRINSIGTSQGLDLNISGDVLYARVFNNGATEVTTAFTDTASWHHVAMIYNGTTLEMYLDGVSKGTATGVYTNSAANWVIGKWNNGANYFDGSISEVTIFDYALSSTQVSSLYNSGSPINPMTLKPAPIAYYPLGGNISTGGIPNTLSVPNIAVPDASVFDFGGSNNEKITTGNSSLLDGASAASFSLWVKGKTGLASYDGMLCFRSGSDYILIIARGTITATEFPVWIQQSGGGVTTNTSNAIVPLNEWNHIVIVGAVGGKWNIYVNGELSSTQVQDTNNIAAISQASPFLIGHDFTTRDFVGEISNVQIWNTELSTAEITTLYNNGVPLLTGTQPEEANLKAWWKLNQTANWEADAASTWQIPDNRSAYPQSFKCDSGFIDLNGSNLAPILNGLTNFTLSLWYKQDAVSNRFVFDIKDGTNRIALQLANASTNYFYFNSAFNSYSAVDTPINQWNNLVFVFDGSQANADRIKLYINGSQITAATTGTIDSTLGSFGSSTIANLGAASTGGSLYALNGKISNCQIFNSSLPATGTNSVETLYNNGTPLTTAIATDNLKGWWKLNNNEIFNGTNWEVENQKYPAGFDSALDFVAVDNDYIDLGTDSSLDIFGGDFSVSLWFKHSNASGSATPLLEIAGFSDKMAMTLGFTSNTGVGFAVGSTWNYNAGSGFNDGNWHHMVATKTGSTYKIYVDSVDTAFSSGSWGYGSTNTIARGKNPSGYYNGKLSNIAIFNTTLDSAAVTALYNNGTPETSISSSPVSWWKLNNLTTGIQDSVGSNDGTNSGATKVNTFVSTQAATSSGMTEQNLVFNNVSSLNGESSGMDTSNLVTSTLTRQVPYNSYSIYFDGTDDQITTGQTLTSLGISTEFTVSFWFNSTNLGIYDTLLGSPNGNSWNSGFAFIIYNSKLRFWVDNWAQSGKYVESATLSNDTWYHAIGTFSTTNGLKLYINGGTPDTASGTTISGLTNDFIIGSSASAYYFDGKLSNISIFNEELTSTEVLKLYNSGVPSNLSSFNPTPVSWWSLGSDSYYNGSNWICPDLISTNNGTSANMDDDALIGDAPNSTANGTATNMAIDANLASNAPNSSNNSFSVNMDSQDRETSVPG